MRDFKKKFVWVAVLAMVMSFVITVPAYAEEEFTVHAQVTNDWGTPAIWAWSDPDLVNVFEAWPGQQLTADDSNPGWYYCSIPTWANCIIINDNGVGKQTANLPVEAKELWVTVSANGEASVVYEAPEGFGAAASEVTADDTATEDTSVDAAAEDSTTDPAATTEVPKTGVSELMYLYMGLAGLSGAGYIAAKRKSAR